MEQFSLPPTLKLKRGDIASKLEESIQAFCNISDVPVTYFNNDGKVEWEFQGHGKLCAFFDIYKDSRSVCGRNLASSAKLAAQLGEPYVFVCKAGLVKIALSLIIDGEEAGCFIAGPIIMGGLKESIITNIFSLSNVHLESYPKIILFLRSMKVFKPKEVSHLASLLSNSILAPITPNENYSKINTQYKEQQRIGENLQKYKKENKSMPYPYDLENQLVEKVKDGDTEESLIILNRLMGEISLIEAGDLSSIKTKVLSICSLLSRLATEKSILSTDETESYFYDMNELHEADTFGELSLLASNLVKSIVNSFSNSSYFGNSQIVKLAIHHINENYRHKLSLKTVAANIHTNPSYLSMLFKQETGLTFTDYLNQFRINRSCDLLISTNQNLIDIAILSGFDDQSYFSKVFKRVKGISPKDYRKSHSASSSNRNL